MVTDRGGWSSALTLPLSVGDSWSLKPTYSLGVESSGTSMAIPRSRLINDDVA
jgi:hypothetical protein